MNNGKSNQPNFSDCKPNYGNVAMGTATGAVSGARGGLMGAAAGAAWGGGIALANETRNTANCIDKKVQQHNQEHRNAARSSCKK